MENKKKLIYAEDAEKALLQLRKGFRRIDEKCAVGSCILELIDVPTVDAVEVVRCKDCKKAVRHEIFPWSRRCKVEDCKFSHKETHFCSYGERRE